MTEYELGWVVGFLEGEGSFYCGTAKYRTVLIRASQVQLSPLIQLRDYTGIGKITREQKKKAPRQQPFYSYWVAGSPARALCTKLRPYMSPKRQAQIDTALERWRDKPSSSDRRIAAQKVMFTKGAAGLSAATRKAWLTRRGDRDPRQLKLIK